MGGVQRPCHARHAQCARGWIHSVQEVLTRGLAVFFDPSPPSPLPSKGRGGIEAAFRPDRENFNAIGGGAGMQSVREVLWLVLRGCRPGLMELA